MSPQIRGYCCDMFAIEFEDVLESNGHGISSTNNVSNEVIEFRDSLTYSPHVGALHLYLIEY